MRPRGADREGKRFSGASGDFPARTVAAQHRKRLADAGSGLPGQEAACGARKQLGEPESGFPRQQAAVGSTKWLAASGSGFLARQAPGRPAVSLLGRGGAGPLSGSAFVAICHIFVTNSGQL